MKIPPNIIIRARPSSSAKGKVLIHWSLHRHRAHSATVSSQLLVSAQYIPSPPTTLGYTGPPFTWNANTTHTCHELMAVDSMLQPVPSIFAFAPHLLYFRFSPFQRYIFIPEIFPQKLGLTRIWMQSPCKVKQTLVDRALA